MLFGVAGAFLGGRIPSVLAYGSASSVTNGTLGMAVTGAIVFVVFEAFLQIIRF
jgi:uncharacterized membrane protein YeaQ/YmgE (transglycosylase-associated protein family)